MKAKLNQYSVTFLNVLKVFILFICVITMNTSFGQSKQYRFIAAKFANIASYAHPFNDALVRQSSIEETATYVDLTIKYSDSSTKLRFTKGGFPFYISSMQVLYDTDSFVPFKALDNMKNIAINLSENSNNGNNQAAKNQLERAFYANMKTWKGAEIALFCLNMEFLDFR